MKKEIKKIEDNLQDEGIQDYIVEGCNVSEKLRQNREATLNAKIQRNAEAKTAEFYKNAFGITLSFLVCFILIAIGAYLLKDDTYEKGMEYCQSQGYSFEYCQRGL